jgi:hypothetical protein
MEALFAELLLQINTSHYIHIKQYMVICSPYIVHSNFSVP